eukprot:Pgem_evm1s5842
MVVEQNGNGVKSKIVVMVSRGGIAKALVRTTEGHAFCCPDQSSCKDNHPHANIDLCCTNEMDEIVRIDNVTYHPELAKVVKSDTFQQELYFRNEDSIPQYKAQTGFSTTITTSVSNTQNSGRKTTVTTTFKAGVPIIISSELTFIHEESFKFSETKTFDFTTTVEVQDAGWSNVAAFSQTKSRIKVVVPQYTVPWTGIAYGKTKCGRDAKPEVIKGETTTKGAKTISTSQTFVEITPNVPVSCKSIEKWEFDDIINAEKYEFCGKPDKYCKTNPLCGIKNVYTNLFNPSLGDVCCDTSVYNTDKWKELMSCCAVAIAHPKCVALGYENEKTELCPKPDGTFHECCE